MSSGSGPIEIHEGKTGWVAVTDDKGLRRRLLDEPILLYRQGASAAVAVKAADGVFDRDRLA